MNRIKIAPNFYLYEFVCSCCGVVKIDEKAITYIQAVRDYYQLPVIIISGYRCPNHDKKIGGKGNHPKGIALDWTIKGKEPEELLETAELCGFTGLGLYKGRHFVHTDTGRKRRWVY